ncbi:MAG: type II toxin-antitoxin system VapC family toxin [Bacteroidetes bacterium]|nr:type II toxin-antitoxin system VapC family toxin [Bacteroidota bacterium]
MTIFVDANILIAVLNKEYPLFSSAAKVLSLADREGFTLCTSPVCVAIAFYFSAKKSGEQLAKKKIELLLKHLSITTIDEACTKQAIANKKVVDVEDGIQYYSALKFGIDYLITDDTDDFYYSTKPVMQAPDFLKTVIGGH